MKKNIIIIIGIIAVLIFGRIIFNFFDKQTSSKFNLANSTPVITADIVKTRKMHRQYTANARVTAKYRVQILARINGYLTKSYFKEGDYVKAGQSLFEIEPQEYKYAASRAKANLDNVKAQAAYYRKQLARYKELVGHDYIAKSDYDNMLAQSSAYSAQVESAENAYRDALRNLGYTNVKAPVDGRVGVINVTVGNYVTTSVGDLTTINSADPMYIMFDLDVKDYAELTKIDNGTNVNRDVEFKFSSGEKYELAGVQDFHDNKINESTGTITLRATFPNPEDKLIHGDFGTITIFSKSEADVNIVPQSAVMENQEGKYVYKLDKDNLPRLTYIKTYAETSDGYWIVSSGINSGDIIATSGIQKIIPGESVKIIDKTINNTNIKKESLIQKVIRKIKNLFKHSK